MISDMKRKNMMGVTLIELMLVAVIISGFIVMGMKYVQEKKTQWVIDKTVSDMQQILNAGAAYYVANGKWPSGLQALKCLQGDVTYDSTCTVQYLSPSITRNPTVYFDTGSNNPGPYYYAFGGTNGDWPSFFVWNFFSVMKGPGDRDSPLPMIYTKQIANRLPNGYSALMVGTDNTKKARVALSACDGVNDNIGGQQGCEIVASIPIPSQSLAAASAINFAGLYHHGACVPVPTCPVDASGMAMTPQIMVVPSSVSGVNDVNLASPDNLNLYSINSFTAYATGGTSADPAACTNGAKPLAAQGGTPCGNVSGSPSSGKYWRVCLQVITERGDVALTSGTPAGTASSTYPTNPWGGNVTLMAITRCAINAEASGSTFDVFSQ